MKITETSKGNIAIIALEGTLDSATAPELRGNRTFIDPEKTVVLDLEKLDFINSPGLRAIVSVTWEKRDPACGIVLSCMNDKVRKVFEITNIQRLFHIFDDTSAAVDFAATRQCERT